MITVVDYGMGNIGSIVNMIKKAGGEADASADPNVIAAADKLILPGVGAFDNGMKRLEDIGMIPVLHKAVLERKVPIMGVCLGMQLFTKNSEEGSRPGLGWLDARTVRFRPSPEQRHLKVPHMGWNLIRPSGSCALFAGMLSEPYFYFVHAYHVVCADPADAAATTSHIVEFTSALHRNNIYATQFHPEKSHKYGLKVMGNFLAIPGAPC